MTESKPREFEEVRTSEMWVGFTKDNFARWMAPKHPDMDKCPFSFISESDDKCVDVKVFVEKSAYQKAVDALRDIANQDIMPSWELIDMAEKALKELGEL